MRSTNAHAIACGLHRGRIEFTNTLRAGQDVAYYVIFSLIILVVLWLNRNSTLPGTDLSVATFMLPGLLRLKSVPGGMTGYVSGQLTRNCLETAFSMTILLVPASFLVSGLTANGIGGVMEALGFILLGLFAVLPLGFIVGSVFKNPRSVGGWGMLAMGAIVWVSGIFSPLATAAGWMQVVGQLTPTYWLGLGLRSALLPESAAAVEIDGSWRTLATVGVLLLWAVAGFLLAPPLLRRMARRESGSSVAARREKALQRV